MTNIQITPSKLFTGITVLACIAILGASYAIIRPKPNAVEEMKRLRARELSLREDTAKLVKSHTLASAKVSQYLSAGTPDEIETKVTNRISEIAKKHGLRVVAVRPQKAQVIGSLLRLPFIVALEGRFPEVIAFAGSLGTPDTRLAVTQLQVTSADTGSDLVTATLGLLAVREPVLSQAGNKN